MASTIGVSYDPQTTATALAQKYIAPMQDILTNQTNNANATDKGLATLRSALVAFRTSLSSLTGLNKAMYAQSATLSDTTLGSATASSSAAAGTYRFFVEQIATAGQVSYNNLTDYATNASAGTLGIKIGTGPTAQNFNVDLVAADADKNGTLTVREIATAINKAAGNASKVSAAVVTVGSTQQLMLTSQATGANTDITLNTSAVGIGGLKTALETAANRKVIVEAKDAIVWLGAKDTGTRIQQATNTFSNIEGVKVTFAKAQADGAAPMTVTVAPDNAGTNKNVKEFLDAYNKLKSAVDALVDAGDPSKGKAPGAFAHDAGIRALRQRLVDMVRPSGDSSLAAFGITAGKDGLLAVNESKLLRKLATDPNGLDTLIGSTAAGGAEGIATRLDKYLDEWTNIANGEIKKRDEANDKLIKDLGNRQVRLDQQFDSAYKRYLIQFTNLQTLQNQMQSSLTMFDAIFGSEKS